MMVLVLALVTLWPKAKPLSPQDLFNALLDTPVKASELSPGFSLAGSPYSNPDGLSDSEKQFHALWEVEVDLKGPAGEGKDVVAFDIFPTEADTHAYFDSPDQKGRGNLTPSGFGKNLANCYSGSDTDSSSKEPYGFTACNVLVKNVFVQGSSHVFGDKQQGNQDSAIALAQFGATHLQKFNFHEGSTSGQSPQATRAATTASASPGPPRTPPAGASNAGALLGVCPTIRQVGAVVGSWPLVPERFGHPDGGAQPRRSAEWCLERSPSVLSRCGPGLARA